MGSIGAHPKEDISRKNREIGYFVGEPYWGRGIATSAVARLLLFIFTKLEVIKLEVHLFAENKSSVSVLRKNKFCLEAIHRKGIIKNNEILDDCVWAKLL